jgi:hypothetical protein
MVGSALTTFALAAVFRFLELVSHGSCLSLFLPLLEDVPAPSTSGSAVNNTPNLASEYLDLTVVTPGNTTAAEIEVAFKEEDSQVDRT